MSAAAAGDLSALLLAKAASLPGGRDRAGRPLLTIPTPPCDVPRGGDALDQTLRYFTTIFLPETRRAGICALLDARKCAWRVARAVIRTVALTLGPDLVCFIVLRPDVFWDTQRMDACTKSPKDNEPIYIPLPRLCKYVDASQLTEEFGGTWAYNHKQWIQNRMCIESYMRDARRVMGELEAFYQRLKEFTAGERMSTSTDPIAFTKQAFDNNKLLAHTVYRKGRELIAQLEKTERDWLANNLSTNSRVPQDAIDTRGRLDKLLEILQHRLESADQAWTDMQRKYVDTRETALLEWGVTRVTSWILDTAEKLLNRMQDIGYDVVSSEELRSEHENLELQCRDTYGYYAELLHKIDTLPQLSVNISEDLKSQRDFMDFVCRSFAARLERRRHLLITSLRFYRLVTEYFNKTSEVFETLVLYTNIDSLGTADCNLKELLSSETKIDFLAKELLKEGEKLSDLLSMPVKDALGRDVDVNYEHDILNIQEIMKAIQLRKQLFSDSVDLQKLTLQQACHIHTYERDASQAVQWLNDLFQVLVEHIHIGSTVHEIQNMKEQLQTLYETAKGTYEYGCQLLKAAQALRNSCKLPEDINMEVQEQIVKIWKKLETVVQEQMTRLRVCAVFHRSVQEHCGQLKELIAAVQTTCETLDATRKRPKIRKFLATREKLLLDVGRMVRLGRLLRTRLKEPVSPNEKSKDDENVTSVEAISERLADVTNLAERLDTALCNAQTDVGDISKTSVSPNIKKILDGVSDTTPEEWYSTLNKPPTSSNGVKGTPNTSSDSKSEDDFVTASECTCTPPSRSSSFQTASEGGPASPWWDLDACSSDFEEKTKSDEVRVPITEIKQTAAEAQRKHFELTSEILVREVTETKTLKLSSNGRTGVSSYLLENTKTLLRPDMQQPQVPSPEITTPTESSKELVRHLNALVQTSGELPPHQHSKSHSYDTDNTDSTLPKFTAEVPKLKPPRWPNDDADDSEKIYIIDTSTPSPKSSRYSSENIFEERLKEVRDRRRPVTTIRLNDACSLIPPPQYYCPQNLKRMAIQGMF